MDTKNDLLNGLSNVRRELKALEEKARGLVNQNLADVIASAIGKLKPISEHPDLDLVFDRQEPEQTGLPGISEDDAAVGEAHGIDFQPKYDPAVRPVPFVGATAPADTQPQSAPLHPGGQA